MSKILSYFILCTIFFLSACGSDTTDPEPQELSTVLPAENETLVISDTSNFRKDEGYEVCLNFIIGNDFDLHYITINGVVYSTDNASFRECYWNQSGTQEFDIEVQNSETGNLLTLISSGNDDSENLILVIQDPDDIVKVSLSSETPESSSISAGAEGISVVSYDFTAGTEDVTISELTIKRRGLSDYNTITRLSLFLSDERFSDSVNDDQVNDTEAQFNLYDGGITIEAGETITLTVVVDLGIDSVVDEFALELVQFVANSKVKEPTTQLISNTFNVDPI